MYLYTIAYCTPTAPVVLDPSELNMDNNAIKDAIEIFSSGLVCPTSAVNVRASAILYNGNINEQIQNETSYFGNGTIFPFSFIANSTIANGELSLFGQDFENNNSKPHDPISYATF